MKKNPISYLPKIINRKGINSIRQSKDESKPEPENEKATERPPLPANEV